MLRSFVLLLSMDIAELELFSRFFHVCIKEHVVIPIFYDSLDLERSIPMFNHRAWRSAHISSACIFIQQTYSASIWPNNLSHQTKSHLQKARPASRYFWLSSGIHGTDFLCETYSMLNCDIFVLVWCNVSITDLVVFKALLFMSWQIFPASLGDTWCFPRDPLRFLITMNVIWEHHMDFVMGTSYGFCNGLKNLSLTVCIHLSPH